MRYGAVALGTAAVRLSYGQIRIRLRYGTASLRCGAVALQYGTVKVMVTCLSYRHGAMTRLNVYKHGARAIHGKFAVQNSIFLSDSSRTNTVKVAVWT